MRFLYALLNDIRYQVKYGFYFLYAFFSAIYVAILIVIPVEHKQMAASFIILSDPAMLGCSFIGGIWLLEKGEGLHKYWGISPLSPVEYILSKAISLAFISTIVAVLIAIIGLRHDANYIMLTISTFMGSMVFTLIGLIFATYSRSVNQYIVHMTPILIIISIPPGLTMFGISNPIFELSPGTALWRFIHVSVGGTSGIGTLSYLVLLLWLGIAFFLANRRIPIAMQIEGGEKV